MDKKVILKEGKEKSLLRKHPWIFSGAIASIPACEPGEILPVYSSDGQYLAQACFHPDNSLSGRVLSFTHQETKDLLKAKIQEALDLRKKFFDPELTNAFRLINAEGDGLSGLVVDYYNDVLVLQISTCGMERLKAQIVEILISLLSPKAIYEKSCSSTRKQEGLKEQEGFLYGEEIKEVEILENGMKFLVSLTQGQKTGFFLDQREMRKLVSCYSKEKKVLNCFSYSGGFSLFALKGGASFVDSVDSCGKASELARKNTRLNGFSKEQHGIHQKDGFSFLKDSDLDYDLVILDPPAFAKKKSDIAEACKGYKEINRTAMEKMPPKSLLLTCSCSYHIDGDLFQNLLFQAASEAKRNVKILHRHIQAIDHPISLNHPEGEYLKSFTLFID
jgi:23S rRNA (cytosine1962-C5)-methyltransferase